MNESIYYGGGGGGGHEVCTFIGVNRLWCSVAYIYIPIQYNNARTPARTVQKTLGHNNRKEMGGEKI